jgi:hypothetical protein
MATECANCEALEHSFDQKPAVPRGGSCNDILHECPLDGQRWWQFNTHFHLWRKVRDDREWECLQNDLRNPEPADSLW